MFKSLTKLTKYRLKNIDVKESTGIRDILLILIRILNINNPMKIYASTYNPPI